MHATAMSSPRSHCLVLNHHFELVRNHSRTSRGYYLKKKKKESSLLCGGAWLAPSIERTTLDLGVSSSSPTHWAWSLL